MNARRMTWLWAGLVALACLAGKAGASATAYLNINVTFNNAMSVTVDSVETSTYVKNWTTANEVLRSVSSATVSNNSIVTERWKLYTNDTSLTTSGSSWTLVGSTSLAAVGPDQFALQAVFGSSHTAETGCNSATDAGTWNLTPNAPPLSYSWASGVQYTSAGALASPELTASGGLSTPDVGTNGGSMYGGGKRALCWRIIAPQSTTATQTQIVQVIVAAY